MTRLRINSPWSYKEANTEEEKPEKGGAYNPEQPVAALSAWLKRTVAVLKTGRRMVKNLLSNEGSDCTNM